MCSKAPHTWFFFHYDWYLISGLLDYILISTDYCPTMTDMFLHRHSAVIAHSNHNSIPILLSSGSTSTRHLQRSKHWTTLGHPDEHLDSNGSCGKGRCFRLIVPLGWIFPWSSEVDLLHLDTVLLFGGGSFAYFPPEYCAKSTYLPDALSIM